MNDTPSRSILVTGAAGFIGFHLSRRLLANGWAVTGLDNLNTYYDPTLKQARLNHLNDNSNFTFARLDLADTEGMKRLFEDTSFTHVVNLAAQAGVRYSLENPRSYIDSNIVGFLNILEGCRHSETVKHLAYASSSSVYGANTTYPFSVQHNVDHPVSLYAASKKSNELMAHAYSHLYGLPTTGLRFFTVYGPWGRPDMALFLFTRAILAGEAIDVFGEGQMRRDFTYIDDIVEGVERVISDIPEGNSAWTGDAPDPSSSKAPWRVHNIGNSDSVELMRFIEIIEETLGKKAIKNMLPMQPGDVRATAADVQSLTDAVGFKPSTPIEEGIKKFIDWYLDYYKS
ncbi:MAG: NAD-dependent epimerase [bacterium]|nr:NAD-dependent epimerase [bacterium]